MEWGVTYTKQAVNSIRFCSVIFCLTGHYEKSILSNICGLFLICFNGLSIFC